MNHEARIERFISCCAEEEQTDTITKPQVIDCLTLAHGYAQALCGGVELYEYQKATVVKMNQLEKYVLHFSIFKKKRLLHVCF